MEIILSTSNSPLVRPIVPVIENMIVYPSPASAKAWRNEPGPLSLVLVTMIVKGRGGGVGRGRGVGCGLCTDLVGSVSAALPTMIAF